MEREELPELPMDWRWARLPHGVWVAERDNLMCEVEVSARGVEIGHTAGYLPVPVPFSVIKAVAEANGVTL